MTNYVGMYEVASKVTVIFKFRELRMFDFLILLVHMSVIYMFCALFLKIVLSAAELMSFGHLGAAI